MTLADQCPHLLPGAPLLPESGVVNGVIPRIVQNSEVVLTSFAVLTVPNAARIHTSANR
jgi:hypothetical protein